ncbi:MAG: LytTR family DNA-binding domain-containing protein [Proteobacteria bacterium]|nr:LytTR family DNA-binding domain-containing protein [Pseudomonadota bacterium]
MTTALIADDEPHLRAHLRELLAEVWPELRVVAECENGLQAAERIAALAPDVAFLDIKMPGLTGLEVAQGIEGTTRVVFVTAYDSYAVQAFERAAVDYLLKPTSAERLARAVARVQAALAQPRDDGALAALLAQLTQAQGATKPTPLRWIRASRGDTTYQIAVEEVLYFQSDDKYTLVITREGEHLIRTSLAELAQQLPPEQFWQVHRSTVVGVAHVASTRREGDRMTLHVKGHERPLAVSRAYQHLFKQM